MITDLVSLTCELGSLIPEPGAIAAAWMASVARKKPCSRVPARDSPPHRGEAWMGCLRGG